LLGLPSDAEMHFDRGYGKGKQFGYEQATDVAEMHFDRGYGKGKQFGYEQARWIR